jgi:hypothetical protein
MIDKFLQVLFTASGEEFDGLMNCLLWGCEHPTPDVCIVSLNATRSLFEGALRCEVGLANVPKFLEAYYLLVVARVFGVIQDTYHKFAFDEECNVLATLLKIPSEQADRAAIARAIHPYVPELQPEAVLAFVSKMVAASTDKVTFRQVVRDFLVATRQFSASELKAIDQQVKKAESLAAYRDDTIWAEEELGGSREMPMYALA